MTPASNIDQPRSIPIPGGKLPCDWENVLAQGLEKIGIKLSEDTMQRHILRLRAALLTLGKTSVEIDRIVMDGDE